MTKAPKVAGFYPPPPGSDRSLIKFGIKKQGPWAAGGENCYIQGPQNKLFRTFNASSSDDTCKFMHGLCITEIE